MKQVVMRNQFSIFGGFNFPPTPPTTLALMNLFADQEMMPAMIPTADQNGQMQLKFRLSKGETIQILFANDRVDIIEIYHMTDEHSADFKDLALSLCRYLTKYHVSLIRVARVQETLLLSPSEETYKAFAAKLVPFASPSSNEWNTRWIEREEVEPEPLHIVSEISRIKGLHTAENGLIEEFHAVKLLGDVSTIATNLTPRFQVGELEVIYDQLNNRQITLRDNLLALGA